MGDVYPDYAKLPKGDYTLQLHLRYDSLLNAYICVLIKLMSCLFLGISEFFRHENVQYLEKLKQLVLFIERKLEKVYVRCHAKYIFLVLLFVCLPFNVINF